ncbi:hypothetical protein BXQ17_08120 [Polaribacter sp. BM10]|uniref:hypothetical protein n=1 Tax=Polaribacter sp. BM10 TaxID=1529069 RepID=UPI00098B6224|nr:hypothetical protein [Polaribacter sp. BM10]AQS94032.1 hypothetical protein BXQ17_08120 [Polaribacter sp. BM10]
MFNKPINNIVKEHFKIMRKTAKQKAEKDFKVNILEKTDGLEDFQKLKLCVAEDDRIRLLKNEDKHPYYIHNSDDWLLTQFANRYFLLNVDETSEFIQSVYLGDYGSLIFKEIDRLIKKIPKLTYKDFLAGTQCEYLETFEFYYNIEEKDYYNISKWQMNVLLDIVQYDVLNVISGYQKYCKTIDNSISFITNELSILEEEVVETITDATALKQILSKLYIFKNNDISKYDNDLLLKNYPLFFNDKNNYRKLNPENLKEPLNSISNNVKNIVSNELTLFYVLDTVLKWMKSIIKGKSLIESFEYIDLKKKIDEVKRETENEYQKEIEELIDFCFNNKAITSEQKKESLRAKFEDEINAYNKIKDKRIFFFLRDENESLLLENFRFSYIINDSLDEVLGELKKAYRVLNVSWEISNIFFELFDSKTLYYKKDSSSNLMIHSLMNDMVLDKDDYKELHSSMDNFFERLQNDSVPLDIHFVNHRNIYMRLFEKCISRLQEVLDNAEPSNKVLYIQTRLKELRQRDLRFRAISDRNEEFEDNEDKYPNLFKEFLSIEAEFIKETVQISPITFLPNQTKSISLVVEETDSFKTFVNQEKQDYILKILEDLAITKDGVYNLGDRSKGTIRGVIEALREEHIIPKLSLKKLCDIVANQINLELKSKLDWSNTSDDYHKKAKQYIKDNPFH